MDLCWRLTVSQGGECYYYTDNGILYFDNAIAFSNKILCGIAYESAPEGWREYNFVTVKSVNPKKSSLIKTVVYAKGIKNGSPVVYDGSTSTAVILFGL